MASSDPTQLDALGLRKMASGHLCLNLSERVGWEEFPAYAEELLRVLNGRTVETADGVDIRLWTVIVHDQKLRLVFDDFPLMVSLESDNDDGDRLLRRLERQLASMRASPEQ